MPLKRRLEKGEDQVTKHQKHERDWVNLFGWDIMREIISLIVFAAERPIPRLDLACKGFKKIFDEEMEAYFKMLVQVAPSVVSVFTIVERFKKDASICIIHNDDDSGLGSVSVSIELTTNKLGERVCGNSYDTRIQSGISVDLTIIDPDAKIPYFTEQRADFDKACDFAWFLDNINGNSDRSVMFRLGSVGKMFSGLNWDLFELLRKDRCIWFSEFHNPYYSVGEFIEWCTQSQIWKESHKAVHKWELKLKNNALRKSFAARSSFKPVDEIASAKHEQKIEESWKQMFRTFEDYDAAAY